MMACVDAAADGDAVHPNPRQRPNSNRQRSKHRLLSLPTSRLRLNPVTRSRPAQKNDAVVDARRPAVLRPSSKRPSQRLKLRRRLNRRRNDDRIAKTTTPRVPIRVDRDTGALSLSQSGVPARRQLAPCG
jgi:hypothetical protein